MAARESAKRALVKVLLVLAVFYAVRLEVSRESPDQEVTKVYRHRKTNPLQNEKTNNTNNTNHAQAVPTRNPKTTKRIEFFFTSLGHPFAN